MTDLTRTLSTLYREDASKLLATLLRTLGTVNYAMAEDIVQETFQRATQDWQQKSIPANPSAWLMLTAKRIAIDHLRQSGNQQKILEQVVAPALESEWSRTHTLDKAFSAEQIEDDQLRLLFWICATDLPVAQRLPLALKALCGLSVEAIARALLAEPETIKKRLSRAKKQLADVEFAIPQAQQIAAALAGVHQTLYLLFNEGISANNPKPESRQDVCLSALGFVRLLLADKRFSSPDSMALAALMHLHVARLPSRFDSTGLAVTLVEQNRSLWLQPHLRFGMALLKEAVDKADSQPSIYLLEALIAFEHCRAVDFAATDWQTISQHYRALVHVNPSPMVNINYAIALSQIGEYQSALEQIGSELASATKAIRCRALAAKAYILAKTDNSSLARECAEQAKEEGLPEIDYQSLVKVLTQSGA